MTRRFFIIPLVLSIYLLPSCTNLDKASTPALFPIDSLLEEQVLWLSQSNASIRKISIVNKLYDTAIVRPSGAEAWRNELQPLQNLGIINKPVYRQAYSRSVEENDANSNLKTLSFKSEQDVKVPFMKIYYLHSLLDPKRVDAIYAERNPMYDMRRNISIEFSTIDSRTILTSYRVEGGQKVFLGDTIAFSVQSSIIIP